MIRAPSATVIAGIAGVGVGGFLLLPGWTAGPSFDAAVFTAVGDRLRMGDLPYVDAWDHKPPLIYVVNALLQLPLAGWLGPWTPIWLFSVAITGAIAATVAAILGALQLEHRYAVLGGIVAAIAASLLVIALGGGLTEPLATLPLALAVLLTVRRHGDARSGLLAGALVGLSLLASMLAVPGAVAIGIFLLLQRQGTATLAYVAGAVAAIAAAAAIIVASGASGEAIDAVFAYSAAYRTASQAWEENYAHAETAVVVLALAWAAVPAALGWLRFVRDGGETRAVAFALAAWVAATVAVPVYLGRFETHYVAPLAVPLGVLAAAGFRDVLVRRHRSMPAFAMISVAWGLVLGLSTTVAVLNGQALGGSLEAEARRTQLVAGFIQAHSHAADHIFVWGNEPHLYYLAERPPASRFIYLLPLTTPGYATPALIDDVLGEWEATLPELIVDAGSFEPGTAGDPPLLIDRPVSSDGREYDILDPLRAFVRDRYEELEIVDGWPVYRLRGAD
jgi:hypothetical protein